MELTVLIFLLGGLFLGWSLGANDAANVFGTAVGTRMVQFKTAAIICSLFVILGAIILIRTTEPDNHFTLIIASLALLVGSINVFGGFFVTNRMLEMFNKKKKN